CPVAVTLLEVEVFKRSNVAVFGISGDAVAKQKSLADQHWLPCSVLSDAKGDACKAYQIKKVCLDAYRRSGRVTFVIGSKGVV
ncbi:hypothetical protein JB92DRAFT_2610183, partial [Gautieria morchelliformis]